MGSASEAEVVDMYEELAVSSDSDDDDDIGAVASVGNNHDTGIITTAEASLCNGTSVLRRDYVEAGEAAPIRDDDIEASSIGNDHDTGIITTAEASLCNGTSVLRRDYVEAGEAAPIRDDDIEASSIGNDHDTGIITTAEASLCNGTSVIRKNHVLAVEAVLASSSDEDDDDDIEASVGAGNDRDHDTSNNSETVQAASSSGCISQPQVDESQDLKKNLRPRQRKVLNEEIVSRLQRDVLFRENSMLQKKRKPATSSERRKTGSGGRSIKGKKSTAPSTSTEVVDEIDGDTPDTFMRPSGRTADWDYILEENDPKVYQFIASVSKFPNAPLSKQWNSFAKVGTKIEIPNVLIKANKPVYWLATIRHFCGYKALVQYETFGFGKPEFVWVSFCSNVPRAVGYSDANGILLYPPPVVARQDIDFLHLLRSILPELNYGTLSNQHMDIVTQGIAASLPESPRYSLHDVVEVMDCGEFHMRRLGRITGILADRLHVTYMSALKKPEEVVKPEEAVKRKRDERSPGFWFNVRSDQLAPVGWCHTIGMTLEGVPLNAKFPKLKVQDLPAYPDDIYLEKGLVFETIHPYHLHKIACAKITTVYKHGYFLAQIECKPPLLRSVQYIYHITSPWLLPCGFCAKHNIDLAVPFGENSNTFTWDSYCRRKNFQRLDLRSLPPQPANPFVVGEKFEAVDIRQPQFIGPATVFKIAANLLFLHFDGWSPSNTLAWQWLEWNSPNIYPAGWSEMMGHEYQGHPVSNIAEVPASILR